MVDLNCKVTNNFNMRFNLIEKIASKAVFKPFSDNKRPQICDCRQAIY